MLRGVLARIVRIKLEVRIKSNVKTIGRQVQTAAAQIASQHSCKVIGQSGVRLPGCQNHYQAPSLIVLAHRQKITEIVSNGAGSFCPYE